MATLTNLQLHPFDHDRTKKTVRCIVTANVNFDQLEIFLMQQGLRFKLKCELWGSDSGFDEDNKLFTYSPVKYYPDPTPTSTEQARFDVTLGEGVLDEDSSSIPGQGGSVDEVYGYLILTNLYTNAKITKSTNERSHSF
jgi:hypothetical protein